MTVKKIPISFSDDDQANNAELITLLGMDGTYGALPKALKFGITLALAAIKKPDKVYCLLNASEMQQYFQAISKAELKARMLDLASNLQKQAEKV